MNYLYDVLKIAHCDVKPSNILKMDLDYNSMIGDFGLSKKLKENTLLSDNSKNIGVTKH